MMKPEKRFNERPSLIAATTVLLLALLTVLMTPVLTCQAQTETNKPASVCENTVASDSNENYVIVPVTTELQQLESPGDDTLVCVLINGNIFDDGEPDPKAFDIFQLRNKLVVWPGREKGSVYFCMFNWAAIPPRKVINDAGVSGRQPVSDGKPTKTGFAKEIFGFALEGMARAVGFREAYFSSITFLPQEPDAREHGDHHPFPRSWVELVAGVKKDMDAIAAGTKFDESGVGDDLVKVYPVRTQLGALLCEAQDCMIHIVPTSYSHITADRAKQLPDLVERYLSKLNLKKKRNVIRSHTQFQYHHPVYFPSKGWWSCPPTPPFQGWELTEGGKEFVRQVQYMSSPEFVKRIGFELMAYGEVFKYISPEQTAALDVK